LSTDKRLAVKQAILKSNQTAFDEFYAKLRRKLDRSADRVIVLPLFGDKTEFQTVTAAANFIDGFDSKAASGTFRKYEISVVFSNGDDVRGSFADQHDAIKFLSYVTS
jgi:hypothetical protein